MTDELTFLRELEQVVQRVHRALYEHQHTAAVAEQALLAKKLINDRIIELLEARQGNICSAEMDDSGACPLPAYHEGPHKWST